MTVAVLSGKGGAGKTFAAVNLAAAAGKAVYIDCDVEEPNGRLFWQPRGVTERPVTTALPVFDPEKCVGCRSCVDFCRFNALVYVKKAPMVFPEVCHACGGCALVCPQGAVGEQHRKVGVVEEGNRDQIHVVTGVLRTGEVSAVPVIRAALSAGLSRGDLTIIDCPPGSGCPVMESVREADYCLLVTEPTAFGLHNMAMVHQLCRLLGKPCGLLINREEAPYAPLEDYCARDGLPILLRIPYRRQLAQWGAEGAVAVRRDEALKVEFTRLLREIGGTAV